MVICNLFFSFQKDMFLKRDGCSTQPLDNVTLTQGD